jgi:hypothetical protein
MPSVASAGYAKVTCGNANNQDFRRTGDKVKNVSVSTGKKSDIASDFFKKVLEESKKDTPVDALQNGGNIVNTAATKPRKTIHITDISPYGPPPEE